MSREIKFRYRYTDGQNWILKIFNLGQIASGEPYEILSDQPLLKHYKLQGQDEFTGLLDKNRKEIYEGDIISYKYYRDYGQSGELQNMKPVMVSYNQKKAAFDPLHLFEDYHDQLKTCEVIGNIYSNPELLK